MIRLVLNADDFGLTSAVSSRVAALRAAERLTDVSLLACGEAFEEAAAALSAAGIREAGVHLCLVGGERALSDPARIPSLLSGGRFRAAWPSVALAAAAGRVRTSEVELEWEAQLARVAGAGFAVTHLDSHQHLHLLASLLPVVIRLAKRFGVPFVRAPRADDPAAAPDAPLLARGRARLLARLGSNARKRLGEAGLPEPPRVLGLAEAGRMTAESWWRLLEALRAPGDYEVVLHPGADDARTRERYRWGYAWGEEAAALESPELSEAFGRLGIRTCSFSSLSAPSASPNR